jgi:hypothetical protein
MNKKKWLVYSPGAGIRGDLHETYESAETTAKKCTSKYGVDYGIYELVATAVVPTPAIEIVKVSA